MSSEQHAEPSKPMSNRRRTLRRLAATGAVLALAGLILSFFAHRSALSPDDPPEKTYLKIFEAYGGDEALFRWKCGVLKYESTHDLPGSPHTESVTTVTFWLPGRVRLEERETFSDRIEKWAAGADGKREWLKTNDGRVRFRELQGEGRGEHVNYIQHYHPYYLISVRPIAVKGVESRPEGERDLVLFLDGQRPELGEIRVDMQTKLLRSVRKLRLRDPHSAPGDEGATHISCVYSDYRKTDGGPVPSRITYFLGDRQIRERRFVSVEFRNEFGPAEFESPTEGWGE